MVQYQLDLPAGIPPADYQIRAVVVRRKRAGNDWRCSTTPAIFSGVAYVIQPVAVPAPEAPLSLAGLDLPAVSDAEWEDGALTLLGFDPPADKLLSGDPISFDLFLVAHPIAAGRPEPGNQPGGTPFR